MFLKIIIVNNITISIYKNITNITNITISIYKNIVKNRINPSIIVKYVTMRITVLWYYIFT